MIKYKISTHIESFPEGNEPEKIPEDAVVTYEPVAGQLIHVIFWLRYPSYDFIFGVPDKMNPKYAEEISFFQFRDTRIKEVRAGFYLDIGETKGTLEGFRRILEVSKTHSPHLWKKLNEKKE